MKSTSQSLTDIRCLIYDDFLPCPYPKYFNSLLEQNIKYSSGCLFTEKGNLSSTDLGDSRGWPYWRGCHFKSTPNSTGQGPSPGASTGKGDHNGLQGNTQVYTRQATISPIETRLLYKVFSINKKGRALSVPFAKQLSHLAVGHDA